MLFAISEVVLEMVALGFERVAVLVFDFPATAHGLYQFNDVVGSSDGVRARGRGPLLQATHHISLNRTRKNMAQNALPYNRTPVQRVYKAVR